MPAFLSVFFLFFEQTSCAWSCRAGCHWSVGKSKLFSRSAADEAAAGRGRVRILTCNRVCVLQVNFQTPLTSRANGGRGAQAGLYVFHTSAVCTVAAASALPSITSLLSVNPICHITLMLVVSEKHTRSNGKASLPLSTVETSRSVWTRVVLFFVCFFRPPKRFSSLSTSSALLCLYFSQ